MGNHYDTCRELFEAASEAVRDAARCGRELDALDAGPSPSPFEPRVTSGGMRDATERRIIGTMERRAALESRMDEDERLIDAACSILYGGDQISDGLATLCPPWWADALYHRYIGRMGWPAVATLLCFSERHVTGCARAALEVADAHGMARTVAGRGMADG